MLYFCVMRTRIMAGGFLLALSIAFGAGIYTGVSERLHNTVFAAQSGGQPSDVDFAKFWEVWNLLQDNFVQTHASNTIPTYQERVYGAIAGLTDSYGDPYTVFFPPADAKQFNEDIKGSFGGVGMELGERGGSLTVVAPLKDGPAERAGIRAGDIILSIDGKASEAMAVEAAVKLIRGEIGTTVTLTLKRVGEQTPLTIKVVRDTINIPVLKSYRRDDGIFVIELYSFSENSAELFRRALRDYFESGSTKMILDLRGNPGGYLESAVQMASYFLPVGAPIVTEDYKGKQSNVTHRSLGYNVFANKKLSLAILVDQGTGSVQQLMELGGGAELKITIARWLTPNGTSISDGGLQPDIKVERTAEQFKAGADPQKDAATA